MYIKTTIRKGVWTITEDGHDPREPAKTCTFAFDTETFCFLDEKIQDQSEIFEALKNADMNEKRRRLSSAVWAWQCYDGLNGFFMTNDFETWLEYQCRAGFKFGWCYNAKFDFSQIDYKILAEGAEKWRPHEKKTGTAYNKGQPWTYESVHNDAGARYAYKLWIPYRPSTKHGRDSHMYTHAVDYRDFMNLFPGGLKRTLESLAVKDNDGKDIRKLGMDYQAVDPDNLTEEEIAYCCNDVKGLYFAVKIFNESIEGQSNGECHIFGKNTNIMTAGGFAKSELLRSMYPKDKTKAKRLHHYQRDHPISARQDRWIRDNHLYRGGICFVNPRYRGKLLTSKEMNAYMNRYDVNSEYPFAMSVIRDLIGKPIKISYKEWISMSQSDRDEYECILILSSVTGSVKPGYLGMWFDPFRRDFVEDIDEYGTHLMFERELDEMAKWYDLDYTCEKCLIIKRGNKAYAPFVNENYEKKAQAKREGNPGLSAVVKLKLNSSCGKLSERIERRVGHYELNKDTGAIHFVDDGIEEDESMSMNVIVGSLVTSVARCWILSHIREICGGAEMTYRFVYIDTDSIHAFANYDREDQYTLGGFKLEASCEAVKYIAPKTYFDVEKINADGSINLNAVEIHTKGINVSAVTADLEGQKEINLDYLDQRFSYGQKFQVLCAMNVPGGKVLCPIEKYLARMELAPGDDLVINTGYENGFLSER